VHDYSIIRAHLEAFQENLDRAINMMDSPQIDPKLREAVRNRFLSKIHQEQKELAGLLEDVESHTPLDRLWNDVERERKECGSLLRECLAFVEGVLVRRAGLDNGICVIADALLTEISHASDVPWQRFAIMAETDFFTETTEIIRLRFPEFGVWNLPIVCHEFGHYVAAKEMKPGVMDQILGEYFADLFATYSMGPAYACTCILLNFTPFMGDSREHPADAKRAFFLLRALEKMNKTEQRFGVVIKPLREVWQRNLSAANVEEPEMYVKQNLDSTLDMFLTSILDPKYNTVRYKGWALADILSSKIDSMTSDSVVNSFGEFVAKGVTLRDVLNAAWICRIRGIKNSHPIGKTALDLSLALLNRREDL
jgi:hypothetical protein